MIVLYNIIILVMLICIVYNIIKQKYIPNIYNLNYIFPPSIINDQSFFFIKTKYKDMQFHQCVRSKDSVSNSLKKKGVWEDCQELFDIYNKSNKNGGFIDFGANIGSCSFLFAKIGVKVYAFEPLPNNLFLFSLTTQINHQFSKYITIYPYALGKEDKIETIKIDKLNWGGSSLYNNKHDYVEKIEIRKIDDFDKIIPKTVSMVKIDVEGAEYDLFEGGKIFFKYHKAEYMYIEASCGNRNRDGSYEINKLYNILNSFGYNVIKRVNCSFMKRDNIIVKSLI